MGRRVVLISCVSAKLDRPAPARDLYTSPLFCGCLRYAEGLTPDAIYVLSAQYGLVPIDRVIAPYDLTLNNMGVEAIRAWARCVLADLERVADLENDRFTLLAGERYRRFIQPNLAHSEVPMEGLSIGRQLQFLSNPAGNRANSDRCGGLHRLAADLPRYRFPFDRAAIPPDGIYILFEEGETAHGTDRIVRIGTHRGDGALPGRLAEHFLTENKDRSIFRKNIGRALLAKDENPLLADWEQDLTTRLARERFGVGVDRDGLRRVEEQVSEILRGEFSFAVVPVPGRERRLRLETRMIATVNRCNECGPSSGWLGRHSPVERIRKSGLWLVQGLGGEPLTDAEWQWLSGREVEPLPATALRKEPAQESKAPPVIPVAEAAPGRGRPGGKYRRLTTFLRAHGGLEITLRLDEVEQVVGAPLPDSARRYRDWWSNSGHSQARGWREAGYRVVAIRQQAPGGWVRFRREVE
jgi:hypothetical protein